MMVTWDRGDVVGLVMGAVRNLHRSILTSRSPMRFKSGITNRIAVGSGPCRREREYASWW